MIKEALSDQAAKLQGSLWAFFVRNGHMTILALIGCLLGGYYALGQMPVESDPEVKIPIGIVSTPYPGASPGDVEKLLTDKLEDRLKNIDNLKTITSNSLEGLSSITVEFEADADLKESIRELRDEVDASRRDLPQESEDPIVTEVRAGDRSIITFTIIGSQPMDVFKEYSDIFEEELEAIAGVNKVEVSGLPNREIQVFVDRKALEGFGLSITDVTRAVSANHIDFPVGTIRTDNYYYQVSLKAEFSSAEELQALAVASNNGRTIYLRDIAQVRYVFAETATETRLFVAQEGEYKQAVSLGVYKKTGEDLVTMAAEAQRVMEEFRKALPEGMSVLITDNEADRINEDITQLRRSAMQTIIIIAITLLLVLGVKEAIAAAMSIPILYLISFIGLWLIGETFNFLTFFALILSLGVVIDTSIVVIEGIYENMKKHSMDAVEAALASVATFKAPLIAGTLTTLGAFLPLGLMTGIMGEYVKHIPITVNITLLASLFTALFILPAVAIWILQRDFKKLEHKPLMKKQVDQLGEWYGKHIHLILHSQKRRRWWVASMCIAFVMSGALFATGIVKFNLFSSVDSNIFFVNVSAPEGTSLERTKEIMKSVEAIVEDTPELKRFVVTYGGGGFSADIGGSSAGASHKASINVTLTDPADRSIPSYRISQELREKLRVITEAEVLVEELQAGPPSGAAIQARILGDDVRVVQEYAATVENILRDINGTVDVTNDLELSPGEYHLKPKRDRLAYFGINASDVGGLIRASVFGDVGTEIRQSGEEEDIAIRIDYRDPFCTNEPVNRLLEARDNVTICRSNPEDIAELLNMLVVTQQGQVPLSELVTAELTSAVTTIRHYDTERVVNVKAGVAEGVIPADTLRELQLRLASKPVPAGIYVEYGGENEDTAESMASLASASVLAMLLILVILVYQFKSFKQVFIVFTTMPLAIMGVLYGLAIIRIPLSFPGMIGIVALLGIVVNDAIVLIDKINQNRVFESDLTKAVEDGCKQRLEPVIMTTLTTALGVIPLIFSGETFRDLAIVMAVGITVATIFTLVVIPVLYVALEGGQMHPLSWPKRLCVWVWNISKKLRPFIRTVRMKVWPPYIEPTDERY